MSFNAIRNALYTRLATLTGTGYYFSKIYKSFEEKVQGYPAIIFEPTSYESSILTTTDNLRKYVFTIVFAQEMEGKNRATALDILLPAVDQAIERLESDITLGGTVDFCNNTIGDVQVANEAGGAIIYLEMKVNCFKEKTPST